MGPRPLILGHRGASYSAPENTVAAFRLAREMGADGVELDARRTADDVLVVHHDPELQTLGLLRDVPFARLRAERPDVPTLAEAIDACDGMLVNVEIKCLPWEPDPDGPDRPVVRAVVDLVRARATNAIISSFDLGSVDACREIAPELTTAWLTYGQWLAGGAEQAAAHGHAWLHPDRASALQGGIDGAHELGLRVDVWTVDDPDEIRALAAAGVDAIVTNRPDVALDALL
jgi:glycerophosphoryl diester phosphodiesterase